MFLSPGKVFYMTVKRRKCRQPVRVLNLPSFGRVEGRGVYVGGAREGVHGGRCSLGVCRVYVGVGVLLRRVRRSWVVGEKGKGT